MKLIEPKTDKDFERYYDLRWRILRAPWNQPKGSEKDDLENKSIHLMAIDNNEIWGVGRLHFNSSEEAQIRYMAVEENQQGKGIGSSILLKLEERAKEKGAKYTVLNSRDSAVKFYEKYGYRVIGEAPTLFGVIKHFKMRKEF
ncbi:GNAT family N-acetyltransferase [Candidatus Pacearchaeota archaeon]|nr:GNAT family N-acetyltransferase [Candidatus Pacearchaeota archaeon]